MRQATKLLAAVVELPGEAVGVPSDRLGGLDDVLSFHGGGVLAYLGEELVLDLVADVLGELTAAEGRMGSVG